MYNNIGTCSYYRWTAFVALLFVSFALFGCTGFRFSQVDMPPLGAKSAAEQERDAVREAERMGKKPKPTDYSRD